LRTSPGGKIPSEPSDKTPAFAIVGKTPKNNLAAGKESLKENLNDEIPWIP